MIEFCQYIDIKELVFYVPEIFNNVMALDMFKNVFSSNISLI